MINKRSCTINGNLVTVEKDRIYRLIINDKKITSLAFLEFLKGDLFLYLFARIPLEHRTYKNVSSLYLAIEMFMIKCRFL